MSNEWFYAKQGERFGPFPFAQIQQMSRAGALMPTDMLQSGPTSAWVSAVSVPGLFPAASAESPLPANSPTIDHKLLKKFREQVHALGVLWIIIGLIWAAFAIAMLRGDFSSKGKDQARAAFIFGCFVGPLLIPLGVLTCMKKIRSIKAGLVLSYMFLLVFLMDRNSWCIVILLVILQAHRVIKWANRLRGARVSLTTKPQQLIDSPLQLW